MSADPAADAEETQRAAEADAAARARAKVFRVPARLRADGVRGSSISKATITSYVDVARKIVWFRVQAPEQDRAKNKGIAGYTTITEGDVTEVHRARAGALASNKALLLSKLAEHVFVEACRLRGIEPQDLLPRPRSDFDHEPDRVQKLPPEEAELRYSHFERGRHHRIALVCSQEDHCILELKRRLHISRQQTNTLSAGFKTNLEREEGFLRRMQRARAKYEAVLEDDNYQVLEHQSEAMSRMAARKQRYTRIKEMKAALLEVRRRKAKMRAEGIKRHIAKQEKQFDERRRSLIKAREDKDARVQERLNSMGKDYSKRRAHEAKIQAAIAERHEAQRERNAEARQKLVQGLAEKHKHIEHQVLLKEEQREKERQLRKVKGEQKAAKAARMRKAKLYEKSKLIHKINDDWARMELIKEFKAAVEEERRDIKRLLKIQHDEWKKNTPVERDISPGAGHYDLKSTLKADGGTWGKFSPKSEWDWIEYRGKQTPGPSDYGRAGSTLKLGGGVISQFSPMSDVDWRIKRAKAVPGPGAYEPRDVSSTAGATFGEFQPKGMIEILQDRAAAIPGPGQYSEGMPKPRRKLEKLAPQFRVPGASMDYIHNELERTRSFTAKLNTSRPSSGGIKLQEIERAALGASL